MCILTSGGLSRFFFYFIMLTLHFFCFLFFCLFFAFKFSQIIPNFDCIAVVIHNLDVETIFLEFVALPHPENLSGIYDCQTKVSLGPILQYPWKQAFFGE